MGEEEVKVINGIKYKLGLPQGWSFSSILAILVIDRAIRDVNWDCIMFADDGLVFSKKPIKWLAADDWDHLEAHGLIRSDGLKKNGDSKCGPVHGKLSFLGVDYDLKYERFILLNNKKPGEYTYLYKNDPKCWKILEQYYLDGKSTGDGSMSEKTAKDWSWE